MIARRILIKKGGLALVGMGIVPGFLYRAAVANPTRSNGKKVLIVLFLRGGADGLNVVVPFGEKEYFKLRHSIAIPRPSSTRDSALDLDGFFGFHPSLQSLLPIYEEGHLAVVHAVGSPY